MSAVCFLRAFYCLLSAEPTSTVIRDVRQRYKRVFPLRFDLQGSPRSIITSGIRNLLLRDGWGIGWRWYNPSNDELVPFSRALAQAAQFEYRRGGGEPRVPDWLLGFALRFLSQDPLPPTSVVLDCLTIVATDLGCNVSDNNVALGERYAHAPQRLLSLS